MIIEYVGSTICWAIIYGFVAYYDYGCREECGHELWPYLSRQLSMIHASIVSALAIAVILLAPITVQTYVYPPTAELYDDVCLYITAIMFGYLVVDGSFLLFKRLETGWKLTFIHHFVGAASMIMFGLYQGLYQNSLFYALTELSTITLHLTSLAMKFNWKSVTIVAALITWVLFLVIRIFGGLWLTLFLLDHADQIVFDFPVAGQLFILFGNAIVMSLNIYWFGLLTLSMIKTKVD